PHRLVDAPHLVIGFRVNASLPLQMYDAARRLVPHLPTRILRPNTPIDVLAEPEDFFVKRTDLIPHCASSQQATSRYRGYFCTLVDGKVAHQVLSESRA